MGTEIDDTPENTGRKQGGKFKPGQSGNPAGKPKGARHKTTLLAQSLLDGESEKIVRKVIDAALEGDTVALRLCLERILPPRKDTPVTLSLPKLEKAEDATAALAAILEAVTGGELTPGEAQPLTGMIEGYRKSLETLELEQRIQRLEEHHANP